MVFFPLLAQRGNARLTRGGIQGFIGLDGSHGFLDVAPEHDVRATTGHVGRDGDGLGRTGLGHDIGFARMLFGVEHLVRQLGLGEQLSDEFGVFDGSGSHQHRLSTLMALANVGNRGVVFFLGGLVDAVELVVAAAGPVGRDDHGFQAVDLLEFIGLGVRRARHASQLAVQAEIVLEGDRGHGLVLGLDLHPLLGFHRLVQPIAPPASGHQSTGELVHDDDLAVLHHVVLIAVVDVVRAQRRIQVMHEADVRGVIQ